MRRRWLIGAAVVVLAGVGGVVAVDRLFFSQATRTCPFVPAQGGRAALQRILNGLVTGPSQLAPGAAAYVAGPHGTWTGAAGIADTGTCTPMAADARVRLESVSKIYTATLILQLDQEHRLSVHDTVERWLPGLLPYGRQVTIRELLTMSSGLIDNNDFANASESERQVYLARVKDAKLRAEIQATAARVQANPAAVVSPLLWVRWAAWQPLLFTPGEGNHYSNIGYEILGMIAARAAGKPLAELYRERIFAPLGLRATAYDPQGPIAGPHAHGYAIDPDAAPVDATAWHWGVGAEGGIVSDAKDTGTFLAALLRGRLLDRAHVAAMEGDDLWFGGQATGCADQAYGWSGGGSGFKTDVWVADGGRRVAVLLLNARHLSTEQQLADLESHNAMAKLFCGA